MTQSSETTPTSRRAVIGGATVIGAGALLAACSGGEPPIETPGVPPVPEPSATTDEGTGGTPVGKASDVPVGSGIIDSKAKAVVTQPTEGEFKAFDSTCTHKGCPVSKIEGDTISCGCHGSQYSIEDGSVKKGPATRGLTPVTVVQEDGELFIQG